MSELQRQQQRARERHRQLYGAPKTVNIKFAPKIVTADPEIIAQKPIVLKPATVLNFNVDMSAKRFIKMRTMLTNYSYDEIMGVRRGREIVKVRHRIMVETKIRYPQLSYPQIGRLFNRDHTTVLHAVQTYERRMKDAIIDDDSFNEMMNHVKRRCHELSISYRWLINVRNSAKALQFQRMLTRETYDIFRPKKFTTLGYVMGRSIQTISGVLSGKLK